MWNEGTPSYHCMTLGGLKSCFAAVAGCSDPPGYGDPVDGTRFDELDPTRELPQWAKCLTAAEGICLPTGESP